MSAASSDVDDAAAAALLWSFLQLHAAPAASVNLAAPASEITSFKLDPAAPPIRRLYRHVLECVFAFCRMRDLAALVRVCREWGKLIAGMPSIEGVGALPRRVVPLESLARSPLWHHVALLDERTLWMQPASTLWPQLSLHLPWLRRVCISLSFVTEQQQEDEFRMVRQVLPRFTQMRWVNLSFAANTTDELCNRFITLIGRLEQPTLRRVDLELHALTPALSFAPLVSLVPRLEQFDLTSHTDLPHSSTLTAQQINDLRALSSVKQFVHQWQALEETELLTRMLQPGHALQWTEMPGCQFVLEPLAPLLASLPTLTRLNAAQRCSDVSYLTQLTMLTELDVHAEAPVDPDLFVASLRHCTRITDLTLSNIGCTSRHMQQLLPAFPALAKLHLSEFAKQESLCCFSTPALAASLRSLSLHCIRVCPTTAAELSHLFNLRSLTDLRVCRLSDSLPKDLSRLFRIPNARLPLLVESHCS